MISKSLCHIVCPTCGAINRVPSERLKDKPVCGKCKQPLFGRGPIELSSANFDRHIEHNSIPVLVDFWAPWCGPCKAMAPAFEKAAGLLEPQLRLAKLNTESEPAVAARFGIQGIPTLIVFRSGKEAVRRSGALSTSELVQWANAQA